MPGFGCGRARFGPSLLYRKGEPTPHPHAAEVNRMTVFMRSALIGCVLLGGAAGPAPADDYPSRPVTFVVPYTPGGATDLFARLLGRKLEQRLGRPFVIENKPGASAVIA